ncbi:uncharacterized protein BDV17DRAFT_228742 [Aspergillus undulatus]|uniref:uncharacterized protein n=1 Tax=Aspergillus undulatus TaxID=1810928 RepID=UPI003CCCFD32
MDSDFCVPGQTNELFIHLLAYIVGVAFAIFRGLELGKRIFGILVICTKTFILVVFFHHVIRIKAVVSSCRGQGSWVGCSA